MMTNPIVSARSKTDEWGTPQWLLDWCEAQWGAFTMDVAATADNAKCSWFCDAERDALSMPAWWNRSGTRARVWCNPPQSLLGPFTAMVVRHAGQGGTALFLLPAYTGAKWFHANVLGAASELVFLRGRVPYVDETGKERPGARFDSCLAWYAPRRAGLLPIISTADTQDIKHGRIG